MTESTELTTVERAEQALGFADLKGKLEELAKKSANIVTITNKAGRDECHSRLMDLKNQRVAIEKTGKAARDEATKYAKLVIEKEDALVAIISPEESRLKALRDEWDDARQREREEEERKERERVQAMVDAIAAISAIPTRLFGASVAELTAAIDTLAARPMDEFDDVYIVTANKAVADTIATLKEARDKRQALDDEAAAVAAAHEAQRIEREAEEARLAAERAAFEAEQAAAREAQARAEEEARLAREEADRQAAEARAEADRAAQAERDRQAAELAEQQRQLDEQAAEQRRQAEEAAQRAQEEQEARDRAAAEEQAAREAQAAQERAEREAEAIRNATLYDAASEALPLLVDAYGHENLTAKKLASALAREPQG